MHLADGHASYASYDEETAGRMLAAADLPALEGDVDAMLFGAISLIPEPCGSAYEALMQREAPRRQQVQARQHAARATRHHRR